MPQKKKPRKIQPPSEKAEERLIIKLHEECGLVVIKFSQAQRAQQTAGIADLLVLCPKLRTAFWFEVKRRQGPEYRKAQHGQTPHQKLFQENVEAAGMTYVIGSLTDAANNLKAMGILR